jgi:hypothetical protein
MGVILSRGLDKKFVLNRTVTSPYIVHLRTIFVYNQAPLE